MELPLLVGTRIHVLFHSPPGVLFTFPSRYSFAIGHQTVLSLAGWSPRIQSGLHVPRLTWEFPRRPQTFTYGAVTRYGHAFQRARLVCSFSTPCRRCHVNRGSHNPPLATPAGYHTSEVWALPRSLATTRGVISYFPFLELLRCFSSLAYLRMAIDSPYGNSASRCWVSPFGFPGIIAC